MLTVFRNSGGGGQTVFNCHDLIENKIVDQQPLPWKTRLEEIKSRYRLQEEEDDPFVPRDKINVVIPGQFKLPTRPNGVKQCKKDSSTGGKRVCTTIIANNCNDGFKVGGNCNGQERLDTSKLPPSEFQMGDGVEVTNKLFNMNQINL